MHCLYILPSTIYLSWPQLSYLFTQAPWMQPKQSICKRFLTNADDANAHIYNRPSCNRPDCKKPTTQTPLKCNASITNAQVQKLNPWKFIFQPPTSEIISQVPPRRAVTIPNVKIPAPAFSAVVIGESAMPSLLVEELLVPALESPTLVPPVVFVTRTLASSIKFAWMTSSADICWPTPFVPSHVAPSVHLKPQALEKAVPSHCSAAATAEDLSNGLMVL